MNQEKIGRFIASRRKECSLTQAQLAEKLGITDRAVSKWETGRSMPDSAIMLELCELLSISVNELLKGERISMDNYKTEAEKTILALKEQEEQQAKKIITIEIWFSVIGVVTSLFMIACGAWAGEKYGEDNLLGIILCVAGVLSILVMAFVAVWCESIAGYYECKNCGHRHKPSYFKVLFATHYGFSRRLKCPKCQKKNYHKKVYSADEER